MSETPGERAFKIAMRTLREISKARGEVERCALHGGDPERYRVELDETDRIIRDPRTGKGMRFCDCRVIVPPGEQAVAMARRALDEIRFLLDLKDEAA